MNKTELIERIAQEAGVPEGEAQRHFGAFERVVTEALKGGEEVRITGFGKFSVKERKAREGRNPRTGEKMKIAASKGPGLQRGKRPQGGHLGAYRAGQSFVLGPWPRGQGPDFSSHEYIAVIHR
jgi:DNA-binding protein HU-beta